MATWHSVRMVDDREQNAEEKIATALNLWQTKHPDRKIVNLHLTTGRLLGSKGVYVIGIFTSEEWQSK
ncbi:MAG: hypothetical protein IPJ68_03625 [Candidatus Moraniibacteriota bacterium]|nr:MAG: hypothetical protein IPJ68_03625 [Candidatus Moranbacteria bacterium]